MKKFAIYKRKTGYFYYEYYDNMQDLQNTDFKDIIKEESLPVVLDGKGGYYHFTENDFGFIEVIESEKEIPLPLEKLYFKNSEDFQLGWIAPNGDTYSCDYASHSKLAAMLSAKFFPNAPFPDQALGRAGWIKVIDSWDGTERKHEQFVYSFSGKITNAQANTLFDLGLYNKPEVKELLKSSEGRW